MGLLDLHVFTSEVEVTTKAVDKNGSSYYVEGFYVEGLYAEGFPELGRSYNSHREAFHAWIAAVGLEEDYKVSIRSVTRRVIPSYPGNKVSGSSLILPDFTTGIECFTWVANLEFKPPE